MTTHTGPIIGGPHDGCGAYANDADEIVLALCDLPPDPPADPLAPVPVRHDRYRWDGLAWRWVP